MDYNIIRTNRKSVALVIDRQGNLIVRAPKRADVGEIEKFILQKQRWIQKHQQVALEIIRNRKQYIEGERFLFLGQEYPLRVTPEHHRKLIFDRKDFVLPSSQLSRAKILFADWYRAQAKHLLPKRAEFFRRQMGVTYKKLTITGANSRWGSCSSRGTINFSWRLMAAPLDVVDYVVIHELAHLAHHNHSQQFWRLVGQFCPDYRTAKVWLKSHSKNPLP